MRLNKDRIDPVSQLIRNYTGGAVTSSGSRLGSKAALKIVAKLAITPSKKTQRRRRRRAADAGTAARVGSEVVGERQEAPHRSASMHSSTTPSAI